MNPNKVDRNRLFKLEDLPNIGKATADDLRLLGIQTPDALVDKDPFEMYEMLCKVTGTLQDPCMIDVFMSVVSFMDGGDALPWWWFTGERKRLQLVSANDPA